MPTLYTLIIFTENIAGMLNAVAHTFTRRQINIESLNTSTSGTEGIHRYTITCYTDAATIEALAQQLERKVDIIQARYFSEKEVYVMEQALYKIATPRLLENREISKTIRTYDAKMVEVNPVFTIVSQEGMPADITALYHRIQSADCLLQFVRSGIVAVTRSGREELTEFLALRKTERNAP